MIIQPAKRLGNLKEYYFSKKLKEVAELKAQGKDIINFGIGSPDGMPDPEVISELIEGVIEPDAHGYQPYQGIPELRKAVVDHYCNRFSFDGFAANNVLPLIGSKEGITHISMAYLNEGDQVLIPSLAYPTYSSVANLVQAAPVYYPLLEERNWEPDWQFLESFDFSKVKIIWINYPHMPTGVEANKEILQRFVNLAIRHNVLLVHDNPYAFLGASNPLSIFSVDNAKEVAIELGSLSKTYNMAGWRVGWAVGDVQLIEPVLRVKSNMDSGMFKPIQNAAIKALNLSDQWYERVDLLYFERRQMMEQFMEAIEVDVQSGQAGMFIWGKVQGGDADAVCDRLLYEYGIFITPGHIFGAQGTKYVRTSLCIDIDIIQQAIDRVKKA